MALLAFLQNSYIFEAATFSNQVLLHNIKSFGATNFSIKLLLQRDTFSK